jgi:hypothetical protein
MEFAAEYWAFRNSASISAPPQRTLRLGGEGQGALLSTMNQLELDP